MAKKKKPSTTGNVSESRVAYVSRPVAAPSIDFTADPDVVRVVVEGERLTYGHLFNPAFATEISLIEPFREFAFCIPDAFRVRLNQFVPVAH